MTPEEFIAKWRGVTRTERSASQEHFLDLCALLEVPKPADIDKHGAEYTFEKSTKKIGGKQGFADVWKKHCFAWEYKGKRRNLVEAYAQLKQYADAFDNPPLLIVSDMDEIRVHTNFTDTVAQQHVIKLVDLSSVESRTLLRNCFLHPDRLKPTETRESVTARAAQKFAEIAVRLRQQFDERRVAHFVNKLVFCLFAEDIELLPDRVFADILDEANKRPDDLVPMLKDLFAAMANKNGRFGKAAIPWFNGGLFDDDDVLPLGIGAVRDLMEAARLDWSKIDPAIFGTLFESGLDDKKRAEMASLFDRPDPEADRQARLFNRSAPDKGVGIHYTDPGTIMKIIEPVVMRPLQAEWDGVKEQVRGLMERRAKARTPAEKTKLLHQAREAYGGFRQRLGKFRVLDPACGSGNFLALALGALKDFDLKVMDEAKSLDLPPDNQRVGAEAVLGIEINPYAAELARLTVWITELQWQLRNSFGIKRAPILGRLDGIVCRDALITRDGKEASWPAADVVIGNPPFLGDRKIVPTLGDDYAENLRAIFKDRVPGGADLVCYWFEKARAQIEVNHLDRAGLVATNSIRGGRNRRVIDSIHEKLDIYDAWSDETWVVKGAAVRVSLICFARKSEIPGRRLDGREVPQINADLSANVFDVTVATALPENAGAAFQGTISYGPFEIDGEEARALLQLPLNPNGRNNSDVVRPWTNGQDITKRPQDYWIIFFPEQATEEQAALYEAPFKLVVQRVKPYRAKKKNDDLNKHWWRLWRSRPELFSATHSKRRQIVTPRVSKHRLFVWRPVVVVPDSATISIARDDDTTFGILHSRFHEVWALRLGTSLEDRPRYTPSTTFETFPFPEGLTPNIPASSYAKDKCAIAIAAAAKRLDALRQAWLNPSDLVKIVPEVVPGFPDRILPTDARAAEILKKRTLTNLYNERPDWLANAHRDLDAAVAAAYGWSADIAEEDALARLLELNRQRAASQAPAAGGREAQAVATKPRAARADRRSGARSQATHR